MSQNFAVIFLLQTEKWLFQFREWNANSACKRSRKITLTILKFISNFQEFSSPIMKYRVTTSQVLENVIWHYIESKIKKRENPCQSLSLSISLSQRRLHEATYFCHFLHCVVVHAIITYAIAQVRMAVPFNWHHTCPNLHSSAIIDSYWHCASHLRCSSAFISSLI